MYCRGFPTISLPIGNNSSVKSSCDHFKTFANLRKFIIWTVANYLVESKHVFFLGSFETNVYIVMSDLCNIWICWLYFCNYTNWIVNFCVSFNFCSKFHLLSDGLFYLVLDFVRLGDVRRHIGPCRLSGYNLTPNFVEFFS